MELAMRISTAVQSTHLHFHFLLLLTEGSEEMLAQLPPVQRASGSFLQRLFLAAEAAVELREPRGLLALEAMEDSVLVAAEAVEE